MNLALLLLVAAPVRPGEPGDHRETVLPAVEVRWAGVGIERDLGPVLPGGRYALPARLTNATASRLTAADFVSGCGCLRVDLPGGPIPPGGTGTVRLTLEVAPLARRFAAAVAVGAGNAGRAAPRLTVTASVVPPLRASVRDLSVGEEAGEVAFDFAVAGAAGAFDLREVTVEPVGAGPGGRGAVADMTVLAAASDRLTVRCRIRAAAEVPADLRVQRFRLSAGGRFVGEVALRVVVAGRVTARPSPVRFRTLPAEDDEPPRAAARLLVIGLDDAARGRLTDPGAVRLGPADGGAPAAVTVAVRSLRGSAVLLELTAAAGPLTDGRRAAAVLLGAGDSAPRVPVAAAPADSVTVREVKGRPSRRARCQRAPPVAGRRASTLPQARRSLRSRGHAGSVPPRTAPRASRTDTNSPPSPSAFPASPAASG